MSKSNANGGQLDLKNMAPNTEEAVMPRPISGSENTGSPPTIDETVTSPRPENGSQYQISSLMEYRPPDGEAISAPARIARPLAMRLYLSHFLSTWNSRLFEFGAVLFLASIYPSTLSPMSVYALVRSAAAIVFAQTVGTWIDNGNRLSVVRFSIVGQRFAVAASCGLFWALEQKSTSLGPRTKDGFFTLTVLLACVEKLCSMMNLLSVERDWVVVITEGNDSSRRTLNARMRRIDLLCKLLGPLVISAIAMASVLVAIWATLAMSGLSVVIEYISIAQVYKHVPALRREPPPPSEAHAYEPVGQEEQDDEPERPQPTKSWFQTTLHHVLPISSLPFYFHHRAFLPSFSLALLYLTVLSFSGQMVTYLISIGYTSLHVGIARTVSTIFELSATWVAPRLMKKIGVVRGGIWSLSWQMIWLAAGVSWFFAGFEGSRSNAVVSATGLAVGVALSRVGLWGYDLCAQNIVQDEVDPHHRGTFSTAEAAFQNLFELISYATTVIFSRPDQFRWPVVTSVAAVYIAGGLYAMFVRKRRGHLFHAPPCICAKGEGA